MSNNSLTDVKIIAFFNCFFFVIFWQGEPKKHGLSTSNCRIEGVNNLGSNSSSKLYASPLKNGKRCVVICEGYYEWQTTKDVKNKQPYFIYVKPDENVYFLPMSILFDYFPNDNWIKLFFRLKLKMLQLGKTLNGMKKKVGPVLLSWKWRLFMTCGKVEV